MYNDNRPFSVQQRKQSGQIKPLCAGHQISNATHPLKGNCGVFFLIFLHFSIVLDP